MIMLAMVSCVSVDAVISVAVHLFVGGSVHEIENQGLVSARVGSGNEAWGAVLCSQGHLPA